MKIQIKNLDQTITSAIELPDERRALQNFLALLDAAQISEIEILDYPDSKYPRGLGRFTALKTLRFVRCHGLTGLSQEFSKCRQLETLAFIRCADFYDLRGIQACQHLTTLHVSHCECLDTLPDELQEMDALCALDLSYSTGLGWIDLDLLPQSLRLLDIHGCWRMDFDDALAGGLPLVSVQIQDLSRIEDLRAEPILANISMHLRHTMSMRDGCGLDGD